MNISHTEFILALLSFAVALNLWLTFKLSSIITSVPDHQEKPLLLPVGTRIPHYDGVTLNNSFFSSENYTDKPSVIVFLSAECDSCKSRLPELNNINNIMQHSGVQLWLVSADPEEKLRNFLLETSLSTRAIMMDKNTRITLNPRDASSYYLFIDEGQILQASGGLGDANWQSFIRQLNSSEVEASAGVELDRHQGNRVPS